MIFLLNYLHSPDQLGKRIKLELQPKFAALVFQINIVLPTSCLSQVLKAAVVVAL